MNESSRRIELINSFDVVMARQHARELARELGFSLTDQTRIATAVSEVSRRALENQGSISLAVVEGEARRGIECICLGCQVLEAHPTKPTGEVLGGIRGIEKLMDDFVREGDSTAGQTIIVMRKWLH